MRGEREGMLDRATPAGDTTGWATAALGAGMPAPSARNPERCIPHWEQNFAVSGNQMLHRGQIIGHSMIFPVISVAVPLSSSVTGRKDPPPYWPAEGFSCGIQAQV